MKRAIDAVHGLRQDAQPPSFGAKGHAVRCGQANQILAPELQTWFRDCLGCVAGRREFFADRYWTIEVQRLDDVILGWRSFLRALRNHETIACLYVIPQPETVIGNSASTHEGAARAVSMVAQIMSVLSDEPAASLADGGALSFVIHLQCPVTAVRTAYFDFDAVAFVPEAEHPADPLYDPLMSAPTPMVNINSDIYAFSMFTRDQCLARFDCEVGELTSRERRRLFEHASGAWQRMAERTINNYAEMVDQDLCPTYLEADKRSWIAHHRDPAFAELEKRPYVHEMPVEYTQRIVSVWNRYFDEGELPTYKGIAQPGAETPRRCPIATSL